MHNFVINISLETYQIGLCHQQRVIDYIEEPKKLVSKNFFHNLDQLLHKHHLLFDQISYIACNVGPGSVNTIRAIISCLNGISFARATALIGIDALPALLYEFQDKEWDYTIALLNAYTHDVYYGIMQPNKPIITGCENIDVFLENIDKNFNHIKLRFIGQGAQLYREQILKLSQAYISDNNPEIVSLTYLAQMAYDRWQKKEDIQYHLNPIYLKKLHYKKSIE